MPKGDLGEEISLQSLAFISKYTKNDNLEELKEHVLRLKQGLVDRNIHLYRCIKTNKFLSARLARHTFYPTFKEMVKTHHDSGNAFKYADIGCCFGTDVRKVIVDGVSQSDIYAIDVHDEYWKFGLDLFKDVDTLKVHTLFTDVSSPDFLTKHSDLANKFDTVYTGAVLHVFAKDEGERFVQNIYNMLKSGGVYFGSCGTTDEPMLTDVSTPVKKDQYRYLHSLESLKALLESTGFVDVEAIYQHEYSEKDTEHMHGIRKIVGYSCKKLKPAK
eukprot:Phypoly_transcript_11980.p1 GENE.Phypoly_transcript_11980~~Phypoly_transcript_11980.p1  ORF type:complete len:273 (+),score=28.74 Phypoly_transcript_11980:170-988(+)